MFFTAALAQACHTIIPTPSRVNTAGNIKATSIMEHRNVHFDALTSAATNRNAALDHISKATSNQYAAIQASLVKLATSHTAAAAVIRKTTPLSNT